MPAFRVVVTDNAFAPLDVERATLEPLGCEVVFQPCVTEDDVLTATAGADAILCDAAPMTARVLDGAPRLRVIAEYGAGYDNIDVAAATARGIWVTHVPDYCTAEVADHTMALLLALSRRVVALDAGLRAGRWGARQAGPLHRLGGRTLGLVGFGHIARAVARRALAHELRVVAWSRTAPASDLAAASVAGVALDTLFSTADIVSLHVAATPDTHRLVDRARLALLPPGALLINTSRGVLVDEAAVTAALATGRLAGAALDVFEREPLAADSPLLALPNVIVTPHAAFYSEEAIIDLQTRAAANVAAVLAGEPPLTPVNDVRAWHTRQ